MATPTSVTLRISVSEFPPLTFSAIVRVQNGLDSVLLDRALVLTADEREAVSDAIDYLTVLRGIVMTQKGGDDGPDMDPET